MTTAFDALTPEESYPKARAEAVRALELDPTLSEAHATLATVKEEFEWDWQGADGEFRVTTTKSVCSCIAK